MSRQLLSQAPPSTPFAVRWRARILVLFWSPRLGRCHRYMQDPLWALHQPSGKPGDDAVQRLSLSLKGNGSARVHFGNMFNTGMVTLRVNGLTR